MMMLKSVTANGVRAIWKSWYPQFGDLLFHVDVSALHDGHHRDQGSDSMVRPSMVKEARSLCARRALKHSARLFADGEHRRERTFTDGAQLS